MSDTIMFMAKLVLGTRARLDTYKRKAKTGKEMPRAIKFCASLYSLGLGPTLIGASIIEELAKGDSSQFEILKKSLPLLPKDFAFDLAYTDLETFRKYIDDRTYEMIKKDIDTVKEYFGDVSPPKEPEEKYFNKLRELREKITSSNITEAKALIVELAEMRGFLG